MTVVVVVVVVIVISWQAHGNKVSEAIDLSKLRQV